MANLSTCNEKYNGLSDVDGNMYFLVGFITYIVFTSFVSIVGNILCAVAILRPTRTVRGRLRKRLPKSRYIFIFNLAITDAMGGLLYPVQFIIGDSVVDVPGLSTGITSSLTILAIAAERFNKIVLEKTYQNSRSERMRSIGCCVILWSLPFVCLISIYTYDPDLHKFVFFFVGPVCVIFVMFSIAFLYTSIILTIRLHEQNKIHKFGSRKFNKMKLVLRAYGVILLVYVVCWLLWAVESIRICITRYLTVSITEERCLEGTTLLYVALGLGLMNSAINPVIYWKTLPDIRWGIRQIYYVFLEGMFGKCCKLENGSSDVAACTNSTTSHPATIGSSTL
ncbi:uncharacterized protein LOC117108315 [Anneissia japonica]|uniref:uncharacterized protein LOC117108315 n=1 Tax=Anneissia japonica TaxID=1529436 RepID=UPI001425AF87|nr:uncharacterized protein LOC117108315 [Anneissia japonica]